MALNSIYALNGGLKDLKTSIDNGENSLVFYCAENNRLHITSQLDRFFLYVTQDIISAQKAVDTLNDYCQKEVVLIPEREDVLVSRQVVNYNSSTQRLLALNKIMENSVSGAVITIEGLLQYYPNRELYQNMRTTLSLNQDYDLNELAIKLISLGYNRVQRADTIATFSIRGDILDIYCVDTPEPYRIEFFGDTIESIKNYSHETMLSLGNLEKIVINPVSDILVPTDKINGILNTIKDDKQNLDLRTKETIENEQLRFVSKPSCMLNTFFIPYLKEQLGSIYDYLPKESCIVFEDIKSIDDKAVLLTNAHKIRVENMIEGKKALEKHKLSILDRDTAFASNFVKLGFGFVTSDCKIFPSDKLFSIKAHKNTNYHGKFEEFVNDLRGFSLNETRVRISASDINSATNLQKTLLDFELAISIENHLDLITITTDNIADGFTYPSEKLVLFGVKDYGRVQPKAKSNLEKRQIFTIPNKGDYVVHEKHGIGISEGIQKVETSSGIKEYYVVLYKDGDRLYLPTEQLDTLEKYNGGDTPTIHKLGGAEFARIKERVKKSVKEMAIDLLSIYQARYEQKGYRYPSDTVWQMEMEQDFEFTLTDDQAIAVSEMKNDMERGKIMDRLLCGDVGFGKTEVAIRIIFKTILERKQAVVLAPTTILAQQHYNLLTKRLEKFGEKVELLCRFVDPQEIKKSLLRIEKGESKIIVATHRILSKDVRFYDLGLLVLDEEQRFGVEQKEKLKEYKNKINILSLSATPIPRTLHMAMNGIRDISTLETPPKNRLPVETYVTEYTDQLLINAVTKELSRGGQVFLLYNKVKTIEKFYQHTRELFDESINIIYAHGQMPENILEDRVKMFYENKAQIMISTTIIENGIDLPNANTLFVIDSDLLGLNQLYQLRGRVGRSTTLAYAYFTIRENKVLTENATHRLSALMENTQLGSGFKIAMRDLEIRGAGNVLGREQHGQMEKVGYEMYLRLIKEGIAELKGATAVEKRDIEMIIDGDNYLDEKYIVDEKARVNFYRRVSILEDLAQARIYHKQLEEMYGKTPLSVMNIIRLGLIKNMAREIGVSKVTITKKGVGLSFYNNDCFADERIIKAVSDFLDYTVMSPTKPPVIVFNGKTLTQKQRVKMVLDFLSKCMAYSL